ncbi:opioid growth factor receptor-like protein 1 isoform X2 [Arapaima gigas]
MGNLLGGWRFKEPSTVEECDSTWDTDSEGEERAEEEPQEPACNQEPPAKARRSFYAAKDLYKYRHRYPSYKEPRMSEFRNLRFYLNKVPLVPDGVYIEEILTQWRGDYEKLENNHTYIQWTRGIGSEWGNLAGGSRMPGGLPELLSGCRYTTSPPPPESTCTPGASAKTRSRGGGSRGHPRSTHEWISEFLFQINVKCSRLPVWPLRSSFQTFSWAQKP